LREKRAYARPGRRIRRREGPTRQPRA
jgi:hypothetical protein